MSATTTTFPFSVARATANSIIDILAPWCENIEVAGSIRREKLEVGDIEIICRPKIALTDLFNFDVVNRDPRFVRLVKSLGNIIKGKPEDGRYVQLVIPCIEDSHFNHAMKLDLFIPDPKDYYRQLAIRTGSSAYSHLVIAEGWSKLGWCGTVNAGLRRKEDCLHREGKWRCIRMDGEQPPVWTSEQDFFTWLKVNWIEPKKRSI